MLATATVDCRQNFSQASLSFIMTTSADEKDDDVTIIESKTNGNDGPSTVDDDGEDDNAADPSRAAIDEEFVVWKKNSPFLYDILITHTLEWPSLTVQWLPDRQSPDAKPYNIHRLIVGTNTSAGDANFLLIAAVKLPTIDAVIDAREHHDDADAATITPGSYGGGKSGKIEIIQSIRHETEINRARYNPANPNVIATRSALNDICVFDRTRHDSHEQKDAAARPDLILSGHTAEGFAIDWSPHDSAAHILATGGDDNVICLWDINAAQKSKATLSPTATLAAHNATVTDIAYNPHHSRLFSSSSDDQCVKQWDARTNTATLTVKHNAPVNCVAHSPHDQWLLASGANDHTVNVWDVRSLTKPLFSFNNHTGSVICVKWSPSHADILGSTSTDRRMSIYDISRTDADMTDDDERDEQNGDERSDIPQLLFVHGGHTNSVGEFSWNMHEDDAWTVASVDDDNVLHVWSMAENIYNDEDDDGTDKQAESVTMQTTDEEKNNVSATNDLISTALHNGATTSESNQQDDVVQLNPKRRKVEPITTTTTTNTTQSI